jgi:tRNA threonylcarbamoyladenosine biosynthesis protein TsaE
MNDPRRQKRPARKGPGPAPSADGHKTLYSLSEDETFEIGSALGRGLRPGALILLQGELGLGKTVLARGIAAGLGISPDEVSSPSFTLVHEYRGGRLPLFHIDLYRVERIEEELPALGIEDILSGGGVAVVEWGERLPPYLRRGAIVVRFVDLRDGCRRIEVVPEPEKRTRPFGDA